MHFSRPFAKNSLPQTQSFLQCYLLICLGNFFYWSILNLRASLVAQLVKNPAVQEIRVHSLGWEDPLEKGKATHSSILAWRIPWTIPWGCKESDSTEQLSLILNLQCLISFKCTAKWFSYFIDIYGFFQILFHSVQFSRSLVSNSLRFHGLQHARPPCPSPTPRACSNSRPLSWWCHPTISSSVVPFSSHLQSFPASGSFQMSQLFSSGGQRIGVSASTSVLPVNIQDWFPLGWTGWISLQSKGLSRVFYNTTVQKHEFFSAQISL